MSHAKRNNESLGEEPNYKWLVKGRPDDTAVQIEKVREKYRVGHFLAPDSLNFGF
jgi:hypothetical protein